MAGPTSVSISNNNISMYDAFKALTTNRDKNRGTIEVSMTGGVTELKCTQHHFYSSTTIRPNADLNNALAKAIAEGIDQISDKLIQGVLEGSDGAAATDKANQFLSFMHQVAEKLTAKLYVDNGGTPELRAMSRNAIQEIVSRIEEMKKYSAAELQKIGVDNLCSPNALKTAGEETAVGLSNSRLLKTAALLRTLNDDTICKEAAKMDFSLQNCGIGAVENRPVARCKENPFMMKAGETLGIVKAVQKENPKFNICTQVCADAKHYACGVFVPWGSQEETIVRDMDPMASAHLKGKGLIRPEIFSVTTPTKHVSQYRFAYTQGEGRLSTSSGYMMKSKLGSVKSDFLFSSLPALGEEWQGMDTVGNTDYYCIAREQTRGRKVSEGERAKANDLFDHLCELHISKRAGLDVGQFREVMMLLMFGDIDLAAGDKKQIVADAIKAVKTGAYDKAKVATGYENAIRQTIRGWIDTARNRGVTCFVGSAVGCGVFKNDSRIVSKVFAEEFVSRAGDMKFVYANYHGEDDHAEVFEAAFREAYAKSVTL